jgi:hypothetical protein
VGQAILPGNLACSRLSGGSWLRLCGSTGQKDGILRPIANRPSLQPSASYRRPIDNRPQAASAEYDPGRHAGHISGQSEPIFAVRPGEVVSARHIAFLQHCALERAEWQDPGEEAEEYTAMTQQRGDG